VFGIEPKTIKGNIDRHFKSRTLLDLIKYAGIKKAISSKYLKLIMILVFITDFAIVPAFEVFLSFKHRYLTGYHLYKHA